MADVITRLRYIYDPTGINQAVAGTQRLSSAQGQVSKSSLLMQTAVTTSMFAIGAAVVGGIGTAVKSAADFEQQMNILQAVTGATADDIAKLDKRAIELGADLSLPATSALDAARAMTELSKAGLSVDHTLASVKGTLALAAAANIGEAQAAEIAATALNAFELSGAHASTVADLLAGASIAATGEISHMADALKMSAGIFSLAGMKVEELVASITLMAKRGVIGSDAGTSLKESIRRLIDPSKEAKTELNKLGVSIYDANGNMRSMRNLVEQFTKSTEHLTAEQKQSALAIIFGADAIRAAEFVYTAGVDQYDAMFEAVTKVGSAQELAAARTKGLAGAWEGLKSQLETLALIAGRPLLAGLTRGVRGLSGIVGKLNDLFDGTNESVAMFAAASKKSVVPALISLGNQFVALGRYLVHVIRDGDTLNDWLTHLSPAFRAVAYVIGTSINQLRALGQMISEIIRSPFARWVGDLASSLLRLVFGVRETSSDIRAMAMPLNMAAAGLSALIAAMAIQTVVGFVTAMGRLAFSILTFPLRPFIAATQAILDFVGATAGLVGKAVTITANVITRGAELAADAFQTVTQFVKRTGDKFIGPDDLEDRTQMVTQRIQVSQPPDASGIGRILGTEIGRGILVGIGSFLGALLAPRLTELGPIIIGAFAKFGGPIGKALAVAAAAVFTAEFPKEAGGILGAATGFDIEGWKRSFKILGEEIDKAIVGYGLAFDRIGPMIEGVQKEFGKLPVSVATVLAVTAFKLKDFIDKHKIDFPSGVRAFLDAGMRLFSLFNTNIVQELLKIGYNIGTWLSDRRGDFGRWVIDSLAELGKLDIWRAIGSTFADALTMMRNWVSEFLDGMRHWRDVLRDIINAALNLLRQPGIPAPTYTPTPTPPTREYPPETGQDGFQTPIGGFRVIPGAPGEPREITAHGQEIIGRPASEIMGGNPISITIQMGGVTVTNEADEQRLAATIEQRLLDSLERLLGQGTPFPHGLNMRA
jgi:TP901 family phage tail tape measure protein